MLWLCLSLPQLSASALHLGGALDVVANQYGSHRWLISAAPGIGAGTSVNAALAREPRLNIHSRKPAAEQGALQILAHWIHRYGSPAGCEILDVAEEGFVPRARVWVEVGASLKLFGGVMRLHGQLLSELDELGHAASLAIAPIRAGAALLAESGAGRRCFDMRAMRAALGDLPIANLPWPSGVLRALAGVGLLRLGELFALPRESFARRFGEERLLDLDCLLGDASDPFEAVTLPPRFARRFELSGEIETVEPLLFPLKRLCAELAAYLRARDSGTLSYAVRFAHARGAPTELHLRFLAPTRDAARLFAALQERLMRAPPEQPVRELFLEADDFATPRPPQGDLFGDAARQTLEWEQALERVLARLGEGAIWTPACVADHRPEHAFSPAPRGTAPALLAAPRPLWLLAEPRLLPQPPVPIDAAERIEAGWWDGADVSRDYHTVDLEDYRVWVFRNRRSGQWYLQGFWA